MKMTLMEFAFCPEHSFPRLTDLEFVIEILIVLTMAFFSYTVRGEKSCPYRDSNSDPSTVQPIASRCTDCAVQ
jgi:hypothetical protein